MLHSVSRLRDQPCSEGSDGICSVQAGRYPGSCWKAALWHLEKLKKDYPGALEKRYGISEEGTPLETLAAIARARGCLKRGEELDYVKTSGLIFDDFRGGKIGRITLDWAGQQENN